MDSGLRRNDVGRISIPAADVNRVDAGEIVGAWTSSGRRSGSRAATSRCRPCSAIRTWSSTWRPPGAMSSFLLKRGITEKYGALLAGGAAGDFSTMTFDERLQVAEAVVGEAAGGRLPVAMGAQTTSTRELRRLAKAAQRLGCRVHPGLLPVLLHAHRGGLLRVCRRPRRRPPTSASSSTTRSGPARASRSRWSSGSCEIPNVVGLKWATPRTDAMEFEDVVSHFCGPPHHHRQQPAVRDEPHDGRPRLRGASLQLLAGMGHPPDRRSGGRAATRRCSGRWCARRCPSTSCGSRSRRPTPAATAISTSCAWNWSASIAAAAARRRATSARSYRERCRQMLIETGRTARAPASAAVRQTRGNRSGLSEANGATGRMFMTNTTSKSRNKPHPARRSRRRRHGAWRRCCRLRFAHAADKVALRTNWLFYGSHADLLPRHRQGDATTRTASTSWSSRATAPATPCGWSPTRTAPSPMPPRSP